MTVTVKRTVTAFIFALALCIFTTLIVMVIRPIPLPFVHYLINNALESHLHAYYIDFEKVRTRLRPINGTLEFHFNTARALDYGDNILASTPTISAEVNIYSIFNNRKEIRNIVLHNPKFNIIRTLGGALKFDIGNSNDGSSGIILETILIYFATIPSIPDTETQQSSIELSILNSDLTIGDEITGSLLHAPNANITLKPNTKGVGCSYDINFLARGEDLHISGECLYNTANEMINILTKLDDIRPALLTEIAPQFTYLAPLEVRLSGEVNLVLDKTLTVDKAEFDLTSGKGTLEIIDYIGKNLEVNSFNIAGRILNDFSHIELDNLIIDLELAQAKANALISRNNHNLDIKLDALFTGASITELLPSWFAYIENESLECINPSTSNIYKQSSLSIDGVYNLKQHQINALGKISCLDNKLAENDTTHSSNTSLNANAMQKFSIDGTFSSPNLTTIQ